MRRSWIVGASCAALVAAKVHAQNAASDQGKRCVLRSERRDTLRVGGKALYVEPNAFVQSGTRALLIGTPTYWWAPSAGATAGVARDSIIGVVISPGRPAVAVVPPIPGALVRAVRAVALDSGRWGVTFAEVAPGTSHTEGETPRGLWFGIHDGSSWRLLERIPMPRHGSPRAGQASALVHAAGAITIAMPLDSTPTDSGIVVFTRDSGGWHTTALDMRMTSYVALAADSTGRMLLAVVGSGDDIAFDNNSLFLFVKGGAERWRPFGRVLSGVGQPMNWPELVLDQGRLVLSWTAMLQAPPGGRPEARTASLSWNGEVGPVSVLDSMVAQMLSLRVPNGGMLWLLDHINSRDSRTWRLLTSRDNELRDLGGMSNSFDGRIGAVSASATTVLIAAPRLGAAPTDPTVVTLLVHLRARCPEGAR